MRAGFVTRSGNTLKIDDILIREPSAVRHHILREIGGGGGVELILPDGVE